MTVVMIHTCSEYMTTVIIPQEPQGQVRSGTDRKQGRSASAGIQLGPPRPADEAAVCAMVTRCSRTSLYRRFHGFTDGLAYTHRLFASGSLRRTLLAWDHGVCVGIAGLTPDDEGVGDLGVLVEDAWQGRGVGTRLVTALIEDSRARGESRIRAIVLGENEFILRALRRAGPMNLSVTLGTYSVEVDLVGAGG
jgi:GNAT superfamily N-acetyltransferase